MKYRILLADDHTMFRQALRMSLERYPDLDVVAEVTDGDAVVSAFLQHAPDVICMDFNMPGLNGIEATRAVLAADPNAKIICLSAHLDRCLVGQMIQAGALGFVDKLQAANELHAAIMLAAQHQIYLSPRLGFNLETMLAFNASHVAK